MDKLFLIDFVLEMHITWITKKMFLKFYFVLEMHIKRAIQNQHHISLNMHIMTDFVTSALRGYIMLPFPNIYILTNPTNTHRNKHVIITSKRRFDVIITYCLRLCLRGVFNDVCGQLSYLMSTYSFDAYIYLL